MEIQGKDYKFVYNLGSRFTQEGILGADTMADYRILLHRITLYFAMLIFNNPDDFKMDFEQFVAYLDENPIVLSDMENDCLKQMERQVDDVKDKKKARGDVDTE
jgi:hypothetical protein